MSIFSLLWLSVAIISIPKNACAFRIIECRGNKSVNDGSDFVFECIADEKINYAMVEYNQKKCGFEIYNYVMAVSPGNCDKTLKQRISVDQHCGGNPSNCRKSTRKNCTFTIRNYRKSKMFY